MSGYTSKAIALFIVSLTTACAGSEPKPGTGSNRSTVVEQFCERADDCNLIPEGYSVDDCSQKIDKSLDGLTENERDDVEQDLKECLARKSCSAFSDCF